MGFEDLARLNEQQKQAVQAQGSVLVIAGAGTGKTSVLTSRIAYLIGGLKVPPYKILAFTFTNKAAKEMSERIAKILPEADLKWIGTYHSICVKILRSEIKRLGDSWSSGFTIIDEDDKKSVLRSILGELELGAISDDIKKNIVSHVSKIKDNLYCQEKIDEFKKSICDQDETMWERLCQIVKTYNEYLQKNHLLDFDDIINFTFKILTDHPEVAQKWANRFEHVLVDEFQDTNYLQFCLIKLLVNRDHNNIFAVGDPNQTIYTWRGAYDKIFDSYTKEFNVQNIIKLSQNYRSTNNILTMANELIQHNRQTNFCNNLVANNQANYKPLVFVGTSPQDEAWYICSKIKALQKCGAKLNDMVVLYRSNHSSRLIEEFLIQRQINYAILGAMQFYQRSEIKDLISYLKIIYLPDDVSYQRIINRPSRGIGEVTIRRLLDYCNSQNISLQEALANIQNITVLTTAGQAKLQGFMQQIETLKEKVLKNDFSQAVTTIVKEINYLEFLKHENKNVDIESKKENIAELIAAINSFCQDNVDPNPLEFLQLITLYTAHNEVIKSEQDCLRLMTIHAAKGLEFKNVFLYNFNDGTLPGSRSLDSLSKIAEERRVAYVAITRAIDRLFITCRNEKRSSSYGNPRWQSFDKKVVPSRFLKEIGKSSYAIDTMSKIKQINDRDQDWYDSQAKDEQKLDLKKMYSNDYQFAIGQTIVHTTFGKGLIISVSGDQLEVLFKQPHGRKTISAKHVAIKRVIE